MDNDYYNIPVGEELPPPAARLRWTVVAPVLDRFKGIWQEGDEALVTDRVLSVDGFELHFVGTADQTRQWLRDAADSLTD